LQGGFLILKSINYWSYPGGLEGTLALPEFFKLAKSHGYEAIEVCIGSSGVLSFEANREQCEKILEQAREAGVKIASVASGIYWEFSLASASSTDRAKALEALKKMAQITGWLGCRTLLTIPGAVDIFFQPSFETQPYDAVLDRAREGLAAALPAAENANIVFGIENVWNKFLLSPTEMAAFIDSFNSPHVGAYVDVANILPYGYPEQWLRILGKRVAGIHFKDFRRAVGTIEGFVDLLEGDVNWPEVMMAIGEIGYEGPVVGEMLPLYRHYPEARCAITSIAMDHILGRA
jgi:L-ribulose-5-phosphate 3-epimerase